MKTKMTLNREAQFDKFDAINDSLLKQSFGGDPANPPAEDGSDEDNLHDDYGVKKIIW